MYFAIVLRVDVNNGHNDVVSEFNVLYNISTMYVFKFLAVMFFLSCYVILVLLTTGIFLIG